MQNTSTIKSQPTSTTAVVFAAQVRSDAPGRGPGAPQTRRLSGVEFARTIRSNAPGRQTHR